MVTPDPRRFTRGEQREIDGKLYRLYHSKEDPLEAIYRLLNHQPPDDQQLSPVDQTRKCTPLTSSGEDDTPVSPPSPPQCVAAVSKQPQNTSGKSDSPLQTFNTPVLPSPGQHDTIAFLPPPNVVDVPKQPPNVDVHSGSPLQRPDTLAFSSPDQHDTMASLPLPDVVDVQKQSPNADGHSDFPSLRSDNAALPSPHQHDTMASRSPADVANAVKQLLNINSNSELRLQTPNTPALPQQTSTALTLYQGPPAGSTRTPIYELLPFGAAGTGNPVSTIFNPAPRLFPAQLDRVYRDFLIANCPG